MVIVDNPDNYKLSRFQVSKTKNKKYDAILINKSTGVEKRVPFGDNRYEQYKDSTGLGASARRGVYTKKNHLDKERRAKYRERHSGEERKKFSSGYFSWYYLW